MNEYILVDFRTSEPPKLNCMYSLPQVFWIMGQFLPAAMSDSRARAQRLISVIAAKMIDLACGTKVGQIYSSIPFPWERDFFLLVDVGNSMRPLAELLSFLLE